MALSFYDSTMAIFGANPLRTLHDGNLGGAHEELVYIRNDDLTRYYTSVTVAYASGVYTLDGTVDGWSIKFIYGERQPTETEWDIAIAGAALVIPDIGSTSAGDTSTYHPVWVRVYCPGGEAAQLRESQTLTVSSYERLVGT